MATQKTWTLMKRARRRTWMPFLCYLLNIIRVNSYAARRELGGEMSHMEFALGIAMDLWARRNDGQAHTRGNDSSAMEFHRRPVFKRMRQSVEPLPAARLVDPHLHKASFYEWKRGCYYCRRKAAKARIEKKAPNKVARAPRGRRARGGLAICKLCWDEYHSEQV